MFQLETVALERLFHLGVSLGRVLNWGGCFIGEGASLGRVLHWGGSFIFEFID